MLINIVGLILGLFHLVGPIPSDLGVHQGQLSICESSNHCARIEWKLNDPTANFAQLAETIKETPRSVIVEQTSNYLHATISSKIFGFVDDLEVLADPERSILQARSVSRLGESDFGVNQQRLLSLQDTLLK